MVGKQYGKKFNEDFKNGPQQQNLFKNIIFKLVFKYLGGGI